MARSPRPPLTSAAFGTTGDIAAEKLRSVLARPMANAAFIATRRTSARITVGDRASGASAPSPRAERYIPRHIEHFGARITPIEAKGIVSARTARRRLCPSESFARPTSLLRFRN